MMGPDIILTSNGQFHGEGRDTFERIMGALEQSATPKLFLFVHGGLVPESSGRAQAAALDMNLIQAGTDWQRGYVVWRSGIGEVLGDLHERLAKTRLFRLVTRRALNFASGFAAVDRGAALLAETGDLEAAMAAADRIPTPTEQEFRATLAAERETRRVQRVENLTESQLTSTRFGRTLLDDAEYRAAVADLVDARERGRDRGGLDEEIWNEIDARTAARGSAERAAVAGIVIGYHAVRAAYRVLKRFYYRRDHDLGPTVVEEVARALYLGAIGAWFWREMKADMRAHFGKAGAGGELLTRLGALAGDRGKDVRLLISAHSAGSVFACKLASEAAKLSPKLRVDLVFMAPAIRMDEMVDLLADNQARANNVRMFTMEDRLEKRDHLSGNIFGNIYRRSLLYLISGVLEDGGNYPDAPISGMERHFRTNARHNRAEAAVRRRFRAYFVGKTPSRLSLSKTPPGTPEGQRTEASQHGGYPLNEQEQRSVIHIMTTGYA